MPPDPPRLVDIYGNYLFAHFRADVGVTQSGGLVSNWADLTGNGHDLVQATPANQPLFTPDGGAGGRPCVESGTSGAAFMQHTGTPLTVDTGSWSVFIIAATRTTPASTTVYTTTLTAPAGCAQFAYRRTNLQRIDAQQIGLSAPTAISPAGIDMTPAGTWNAALTSMASDGTRSMRVWGEGSEVTASDSHTGSIGIRLAEGYIFRFGATFYQSLAIQELAFMTRSTTVDDTCLMRAYVRSRGVSTI